jgi:hypothetical protein
LEEGINLVLHVLSQLAYGRVTARCEEMALTGLIVAQNTANWKEWIRSLHVEAADVSFVYQFIVKDAL